MRLLGATLALSPSVALRPEPGGALAYHFGNRKLTFLKRPELVRVLQGLDGAQTLADVLVACEIPQQDWPVFEQAAERLIDSGMLLLATEDCP